MGHEPRVPQDRGDGMDRAGLSARQIVDQLGHSKISMTQDHYLGRRSVGREPADALDRAHRCVKKGDGGVSAR